MLWSLVGALLAALLGLAAGTVGTVAHSVQLSVLGLPLPVGLLLALALTAVVQAGLVAAGPTRATAVGGVLGWAAAAYAGLATGPGGDYLVGRPLAGVGAAWLLGGPVVLAVTTVLVRRLVPAAPARTASA